MRIALIVPSFSSHSNFGMPSIRVLAHQLAEMIDVSIFPLRYPRAAGSQKDGRVAVHAIGGDDRRLRTVLRRTFHAIHREHRHRRFDLIHAIWLSEPGVVATAIGEALRIPVVTSIGGAELANLPQIDYGGARSRKARLIHSGVMRRARYVTGGSSYVLELAVRAGIAERKLAFAPLPVNLDVFGRVAARNKLPSDPEIVHAGAYIPVKDHETLIRAFTLVHDHMPRVRLVMAGEDPQGRRRELIQFACEMGVGHCIEARPRVNQTSLADLYEGASVFAFPSLHESQGLAPLEAAASGLPLVGSNVGAVGDLAPDAAISVTPGDSTGLATGILQLLNDHDFRSRIAEAGRNRVLDQYSPEACANRFLEIYRRSLASGGA